MDHGDRPVGRCIGCFHDFRTGPCGGCGAIAGEGEYVPEPTFDEDSETYRCPCEASFTAHWDYQLHWIADHEPTAITRVRTSADYPYVWWWRSKLGDRKGQRCRVVVRGRSMNSALVEFDDGYRVVTSRNALRKAAP